MSRSGYPHRTRKRLLFADAVVQQANLRSLSLALRFQVIAVLKLESVVSMSALAAAVEEVSDATIERLEKARETFDRAGQLDGSLRAQLAIGEQFALQGKADDASRVGREVLPKARALRNQNLISMAERLATGNSVIGRFASGRPPR